mgnify:CR=1 FL=1
MDNFKGVCQMKENKKLVNEIISDVKHDMSNEDIPARRQQDIGKPRQGEIHIRSARRG